MASILLIEDYPSLQKIYVETLTSDGHDVELASNGEEGLVKALTGKFDLVLLDLLMPKMGGIDFLKAFDANIHTDTQVIVISNIFSTEILNEALSLGASQYLLKSDITPKQLQKLVAETLKAPKPKPKA